MKFHKQKKNNSKEITKRKVSLCVSLSLVCHFSGKPTFVRQKFCNWDTPEVHYNVNYGRGFLQQTLDVLSKLSKSDILEVSVKSYQVILCQIAKLCLWVEISKWRSVKNYRFSRFCCIQALVHCLFSYVVEIWVSVAGPISLFLLQSIMDWSKSYNRNNDYR